MNMAANIFNINSHRSFVDHASYPDFLVHEQQIIFGFTLTAYSVLTEEIALRAVRLLQLYFPPQTLISVRTRPSSSDLKVVALVPVDDAQSISSQLQLLAGLHKDILHVLKGMVATVSLMTRSECKAVVLQS